MFTLDRHRFKRDPVGAAVVFQLGDKYRFLREFALYAARGKRTFDEFSKADLVDFARSLAPDLDAVSDPQAFVEEIIQRSGLLTDVAETGSYIFAHRSIQEFLTAEELRLANDGSFLIGRANNPEWRQVIQFYSAGLEQREANEFLPQLSQRNPELAGYCLSGAKTSDDTAAAVIGTLYPVDGIRLAALAAATMSPRISVQQMAIDHLAKALSSPHSPLSAIVGEVDALLPLLSSLAGTNAARIAALVPQTIEHVPDDPRLVEPLWRCLTATGIESLPASHTIVARLLTLATSDDGFEELARQDSYTRDFLTDDVRRPAYPFTNGLHLDHNLVTLLAWADYLQVMPSVPNRYFEAKGAGRLDRVEADRRRTLIWSPFWPMRTFNAALILVAVTVAAVVVATDPGRLLRPFGWWTLALIFVMAAIPGGLYFLVTRPLVDILSPSSRLKSLIDARGDSVNSAHFFASLENTRRDWVAMPFGIFLLPLTITIALTPLMARSLIIYCILAVVSGLLYWAPSLDAFNRGRRYYIYQPSPYIDLYDQPSSRLWVSSASRASEFTK